MPSSVAEAFDNGWRQADRRHDDWLRTALDAAETRARLSRWVVLDRGTDGFACTREGIALRDKPPKQMVIFSGGYRDEASWLHVSTSWANRLPTWEELREVRKTFFDDTLVAVQVFPPKAEYVNVHPYCLHLYARVDARTVPDLRIIGTI